MSLRLLSSTTMNGPSAFNSNDEAIELDLLVYDEWSSAHRDAPGSAQLLPIIERASALLSGRPLSIRTRKPFSPTDAVMDIELDDGRSAFVRILVRDDEDPAKEDWKRSRLFAELSILRWLQANAPGVPVPSVLAFDDPNSMLITTLLPGLDALHAYPHLNPSAKEHSVISWARLSVLMFRLPAPQRRFSLIENPLLPTSYYSISPEHVFQIDESASLRSFFAKAVSARRARSTSSNNAEAQEILSRRLDRLLDGLKLDIALAEETPYLTRSALTHCDLRASNVILDQTSGEVAGIVDWEFNAAMPACMSVQYPDWIRYSIIESSLYHNPRSTFQTVYVESRENRNRLCDLYEKTVKKLDEEYYHCLIRGIRLRDALAWIENPGSDNDGFAMNLWVESHLFGSETNHRCA
ncbi:phosphotransferase enzyme family-domain-containing protein [Mycena alexandri]|uniref:Phosphotransferase enzyme family-domain-containing protein n=1 Tax=Mycena alexandri TaxID=1745969 RepID=A0AAD6SZH8_9AGAR|nr:phosphotransferase enzyme family-domain-containing protein [Mycena alexandri]